MATRTGDRRGRAGNRRIGARQLRTCARQRHGTSPHLPGVDCGGSIGCGGVIDCGRRPGSDGSSKFGNLIGASGFTGCSNLISPCGVTGSVDCGGIGGNGNSEVGGVASVPTGCPWRLSVAAVSTVFTGPVRTLDLPAATQAPVHLDQSLTNLARALGPIDLAA